MEAVWDADLIINSIPSTEIRPVFTQIGALLKEKGRTPIVVSLAKGVEFIDEPNPHILTPSGVIHAASGLPVENILYLGGPNIASEVWRGEYATARICGGLEKYRTALAMFFRNSSFVVWDNPDIVNHELMGGLKNVYAIGAGIIKAGARTKKIQRVDSEEEECVLWANDVVLDLLAPKPQLRRIRPRAWPCTSATPALKWSLSPISSPV